jgi:hypothetical protein
MIANDSHLMGVTMNRDDTRLLVVSETHVFVYDITGPASLITKYDMEKNCRGERGIEMFFFPIQSWSMVTFMELQKRINLMQEPLLA